MRKIGILAAIVLAASAGRVGSEPAAPPVGGAAEAPAVTLLRQADAAYAKRTDFVQAKTAMVLYDHAILEDPRRVESYWKASRNLWWLGENSDSHTERIAFYEKGIALAEKGIQLDPDSVGAHYWLGCNEGSYGDLKGVMKSLSLVKPIRHEMAEVIRLDERYENGGAYQTLAVLDYKVPGLFGGSKKRVPEEFRKAEAISTNDPYLHYYLADYYLTVGDKDQARAELDKLKNLKVPPDDQPDLLMMQARGEILAKQL